VGVPGVFGEAEEAGRGKREVFAVGMNVGVGAGGRRFARAGVLVPAGAEPVQLLPLQLLLGEHAHALGAGRPDLLAESDE
jgi:hypothetical protein